MTDKQLSEILKDYNLSRYYNVVNGRFFSTKISEKTTLATTMVRGVSCDFFMVKDIIDDKYVSIVYDMNHNLHVYSFIKWRNRGNITNALKSDILPFIFNYKRDKQFVLVNNSCKNLFMNLGFESEEDNKMSITRIRLRQ